MKYRYLGNSGLQVSELSFGSWVTFGKQADVGAAAEMMAAAFDAGVNFFDNAEAYAGGKSEEIMGQALHQLGWPRGSYLVSTKLFWGLSDTVNQNNTLNRKYLLEGMAGSLERFDLDYVDIVYCHRDDPNTPVGEVVWAMHNIIESGWALYWGTSEWEPERIIAALDFAERHHLHAPIVEQPQYNMLNRERLGSSYDEVYDERGYGTTIWSPLASGLLTGKYKDGIPEGSRGDLETMHWMRDRLTDAEVLARVSALEPLAAEVGGTLAQFSLAWCLQNPRVSSVITGASRVGQVEENMQAVEIAGRFTPELMARVDEILGVQPETD